jgi:uncharacterized RDD family membrane protein YckC
LQLDAHRPKILGRMARPLIETEETLIIETPERVPLEFALASIGNRFLAVAIDHFIQYLSIILIAWFLLSIAGYTTNDVANAPEGVFTDAPKWLIAVMILVLFLTFATYFILFEWLWNGQTPGKRLLKLRAIRDDGRPLTLWEAIARNLLRIADATPGFVVPVYSVGLIVIFLSRRDQRLGDIFAGTVVIRERSDEAPTFAETFSNRLSDAAFARVQPQADVKADVSQLTEREIEVVESFLRRRWDLTERQRQWMAWRIALPLMMRLRPAYELESFTYEGFLEEVLHRFRARETLLH